MQGWHLHYTGQLVVGPLDSELLRELAQRIDTQVPQERRGDLDTHVRSMLDSERDKRGNRPSLAACQIQLDRMVTAAVHGGAQELGVPDWRKVELCMAACTERAEDGRFTSQQIADELRENQLHDYVLGDQRSFDKIADHLVNWYRAEPPGMQRERLRATLEGRGPVTQPAAQAPDPEPLTYSDMADLITRARYLPVELLLGAVTEMDPALGASLDGTTDRRTLLEAVQAHMKTTEGGAPDAVDRKADAGGA